MKAIVYPIITGKDFCEEEAADGGDDMFFGGGIDHDPWAARSEGWS